MKASKLIKKIVDLCQHHGVGLDDVNVNLRENYDTEVCDINEVCEDLYDEVTNNILTDIVLMECADDTKTHFNNEYSQRMSKEEFCYADLRAELINNGEDESVKHIEKQYEIYIDSLEKESK